MAVVILLAMDVWMCILKKTIRSTGWAANAGRRLGCGK